MKDLADELVKLADKLQGVEDDDETREIVSDFIKRANEFGDIERKRLKYFSPTKRRIKRLQLIAIENQIAQLRQQFHIFEDKCEEEKRQDAKLSALLDEGMEASVQIYIELKNNLPGKFEEFVKAVVDPMPPDLREEFMALAAKREAEKEKDV